MTTEATGIQDPTTGDSIDDDAPTIPPEIANRRKRRWGCAIMIATLLGGPILLVAAIYWGIAWTSAAAAEQATARARAAGDPLTVEEMEAYYLTSPEIEAATEHWLAATAIVESPDFQADSRDLPLFGAKFDGSVLLSGENLQRSQAYVETYDDAIEEAHAARRAGAVARIPIDFDAEADVSFDHVQSLRSLANLLHLACEVHLARGELDDAVEDVLSLIAVSESMRNDPLVLFQLVRIAINGVAAATARELLNRAELSDEQLARLQDAFARQDFAASQRYALRGEQWYIAQGFRGNRGTGDPDLDRFRMSPFWDADYAKSLDLWRELIAASDEGLLETLEVSERVEGEIEAIMASRWRRFQYPITCLTLPAIDASINASLRGQAEANLAQAAIACERYRLAHGDWPATLDDLVPDYVAAVPLDPFDERPLWYVVEKEGILLYSIGVNRRDDSGFDDYFEGDVPYRLTNRVPTPPAADETPSPKP